MQSLSQQFLTWCRGKPADEAYCYFAVARNGGGCAIIQFCVEHGIPIEAELDMDCHRHPAGLAAASRPWTFGALADRLEASLAEQPA